MMIMNIQKTHLYPLRSALVSYVEVIKPEKNSRVKNISYGSSFIRGKGSQEMSGTQKTVYSNFQSCPDEIKDNQIKEENISFDIFRAPNLLLFDVNFRWNIRLSKIVPKKILGDKKNFCS